MAYNSSDWAQILIFVGLLVCVAPLFGSYIAKVFEGRAPVGRKFLARFERFSYRISDVNPNEEMSWKTYAKALLLFNFFGFLFLLLLQLAQNALVFNPQNMPAVPLALAINTATSFVTNTNWQAYSGENTLSYLTQMMGLTVQNFLSAATGMCVLIALIRGITRRTSDTIGNFWVDLVRGVVYILLPLSILFAVVLVSQGVIQTCAPYVEVTGLENVKQTIPLGPVASQVAIKQLGTNGGGFFGANGAHPFENPTGLSNFLEMFAILLIPASLVFTYGNMVCAKKHAWLLFLVMGFFWIAGFAVSSYSEHVHNPILGASPVLEGKETRFGIVNSILWSVSTTTTANGSVNAMLSSLSPLVGAVLMTNIMVGELIFGGVGVGLCSMIMFVLLTLFLSGLMVGRTPEYFGKKLGKKEMQWVVVAALIPGILILIGSGISSILPIAQSSLTHTGPHGLSEILYAFSSCAGNNGSAFSGLNANTSYYNLVLSIVMLIGRLSIIIPSLAVAGLLAEKKSAPASVGSFSIDTALFACLLIGSILIICVLTFAPGLILGPVVEHFLMIEGRSF